LEEAEAVLQKERIEKGGGCCLRRKGRGGRRGRNRRKENNKNNKTSYNRKRFSPVKKEPVRGSEEKKKREGQKSVRRKNYEKPTIS